MPTYWIASWGDDTAGSGTQVAPWATVSKYLTVAGANDVLMVVGPGTYNFPAMLSSSLNQRITGCLSDGSIPAFADRPIFRATASIASILNFTGAGLWVEYIRFDGNSLTTTAALQAHVSSYHVFCDYYGSLGRGISGFGFAASSKAYNNSGNGFHSGASGGCEQCVSDSNGGDGFLVTTALNCAASRNTGVGFSTYGITASGRYVNCTSVRNTNNGFWFNGENHRFWGCISAKNGRGYVSYGFLPRPVSILNSVVWNNTLVGNSDHLIPLTANPLFVDIDGSPPDLRLGSGSPYLSLDFGASVGAVGALLPPAAGGGSTIIIIDGDE